MKLFFSGTLLITLATFLAIPSAAETKLRYAGATTLQRFFMPEAARLFYDQTGVQFEIEGGNTNPGISALRKGNVDLAGAGRYLSESEKSEGLVEHFLGWDVLAIVVHRDNPIENLSSSQIQDIFSGKILNWQAVGGLNQPIIIITSPRGSGMRSSVQQLVLKERNYNELEVVVAIVAEADQQVSLFPSGITALSQSMVDTPKVKTIKVDGIEPTFENVANAKYRLAKPLTLVTRGVPENILKQFIDFSMGKHGQKILKKYFVPKPPESN